MKTANQTNFFIFQGKVKDLKQYLEQEWRQKITLQDYLKKKLD